MLIKIYRFSKDGFIPKYQKEIAEEFTFWKNYKLTEEDKNCYQQLAFEKIKDRMNRIDINQLQYSLFSFVNKPTLDIRRLLLNHLNKKEKAKKTWWKAVIDDSAIVYADMSIVGKVERYDKFILKNLLNDFPYYDSVIIPNISINKIKNIERIDII